MDAIVRHFFNGFRRAVEGGPDERRIGAELKFPLVNLDGSAAPYEAVCALWDYLQERGWRAEVDEFTGRVVGARTAGERNDTVAGCETGYCKVEFSLAHVADLFALDDSVRQLRALLKDYCAGRQVRLLGLGIHPVTAPGANLLMKKGRTGVWDKVFGANRCLPPERGDDVCLFTVNTASHVHVSTTPEEAIDAVNVLNGFAGGQIALTANSRLWQGRIDPDYRCVAEKFWDWWMPDGGRVGVPIRRFGNLADYVETIAAMRPVYVMRDGQPIVLKDYGSFAEYFASGRATGEDADGRAVAISPAPTDIDLHNSCYWFNARLSRYYTVENRANDQQPPDEMLCVAALTLGLVSALDDARAALEAIDWSVLRQARNVACADGLAGRADGLSISDLSGLMLRLAERGLRRRGCGEEVFLEPLLRRLANGRCPADDAAELFRRKGIEALVNERSIC